MTLIRKNPFGAVQRILKFAGGLTGLDRFAQSADITPVYDLSRTAEKGSGLGSYGGLILLGCTNTHAAANTQNDAINLVAWAGAALGMDRFEISVWLMDIFVWSTTLNVTSARAGLHYSDRLARHNSPSAGYHHKFLFYGTAAVAIGDHTSTGNMYPIWQGDTGGAMNPMAKWPIEAHVNQRLSFRTISSGAAVMECVVPAWVGPKGSSPAGFG